MRKLLWLALVLVACASAQARDLKGKFPYAQAGLDERQAAAHLLNRFTFGPRPGEVDEVVAMGLEKWLASQMLARGPEDYLDKRLAAYPSLQLSDRQINAVYLQYNVIGDLGVAAGNLTKQTGKETDPEKKAYDQALRAYARANHLHFVQELYQELMAQKMLRAVYSPNQVWEVMTDFWFNHFNVSFASGAQPYTLSYERDAIRPNSLGPFQRLLTSTSKHPAMLAYLNNAQSVAPSNQPTTMEVLSHRTNSARRKSKAGLNENYAREVMELHTLGVDGGYTQTDVTQLARALTGWTIYPMDPREGAAKQRDNLAKGRVAGAVMIGDLVFRPDLHDAGEKTILGHTFPEGGGLAEGEKALHMLAEHPSTARFLARELATRFVCDDPPPALINRLAETFKRTEGDTGEILYAIAMSPEFWAATSRRAKIKSPFELVVSSLRALNADVEPGPPLYNWMAQMGQPLYSYNPPTGFPDKAMSWINSGTLVSRMNYGLALALGQIKGVKIDMTPLSSTGTVPADQDLARVAEVILPGRDLAGPLAALKPMINDPTFTQKMATAALKPGQKAPPPPAKKPAQLNQVVGILIGSPEFQRR